MSVVFYLSVRKIFYLILFISKTNTQRSFSESKNHFNFQSNLFGIHFFHLIRNSFFFFHFFQFQKLFLAIWNFSCILFFSKFKILRNIILDFFRQSLKLLWKAGKLIMFKRKSIFQSKNYAFFLNEWSFLPNFLEAFMVQITTSNENNDKLLIWKWRITKVRNILRLLLLSLNNRSEKNLSKNKIKTKQNKREVFCQRQKKS